MSRLPVLVMRGQLRKLRDSAIEAGAHSGFAWFLFEEVLDRLDCGKSFDCDAFRRLHELAGKRPSETSTQG